MNFRCHDTRPGNLKFAAGQLVGIVNEQHCTAVVKWFNNDKGYGFLVDQDGQDVFVHQTNLLMDGYRYLIEGQEVEYLPVTSDRGPSSAEVVPLGDAESMVMVPLDPVLAAKVLCEVFSSDQLFSLSSELDC